MQQHKFTVCRLETAHLGGVAVLEQLCFPLEPWSESSLAVLCRENGVGFAAVEEDGTVSAYVGMTYAAGEGSITNVATHPAYRRQGLASTLLTALVLEAKARSLKTLSLEVRESNLAAVRLYESHGFSVGGKRHSFYKNPREDALVMICNL